MTVVSLDTWEDGLNVSVSSSLHHHSGVRPGVPLISQIQKVLSLILNCLTNMDKASPLLFLCLANLVVSVLDQTLRKVELVVSVAVIRLNCSTKPTL